jgi:hypothetical protein
MLAERPKRPELVPSEHENYAFYFLPDELKFGKWTSRIDAEAAIGIYWAEYSEKPRCAWESYCRSRGFNSVHFV